MGGDSARSEAELTRFFARKIQKNSKSFALACRVLPRSQRHDVMVVYAWCRRADDAIDQSSGDEQARSLRRLRGELTSIYAGEAQADPTLAAFQRVIDKYAIPALYPFELVRGMGMDVDGVRYHSLDELLLYCYRVAGTVGLILCHVFGVSDARALQHAAHLGIAMQLSNVCRDVHEDWQLGRLYLPDSVLEDAGASGLWRSLGKPFPTHARRACRAALAVLLAEAERYYQSADAGIRYLPWGAALGVRTARSVYAEIGAELLRQGYDVCAPRAVVPGWRKAFLLFASLCRSLWAAPASIWRGFRAAPLDRTLGSADVVRI
jgi:phytoene synthase